MVRKHENWGQIPLPMSKLGEVVCACCPNAGHAPTGRVKVCRLGNLAEWSEPWSVKAFSQERWRRDSGRHSFTNLFHKLSTGISACSS